MSLSCVVAMRRERKKKDKKINEVERTWLEDDKKNEKKKKKEKEKKTERGLFIKEQPRLEGFFSGGGRAYLLIKRSLSYLRVAHDRDDGIKKERKKKKIRRKIRKIKFKVDGCMMCEKISIDISILTFSEI